MKRLAVPLVALAVALVRPAVADHVPDGEAEVVDVIDGDTIDVQLADGSIHRVRYIGIDAPETDHPTRGVDCFGPEASARNRELALGATVYLEREVSDVDRFGRLLRHVWVGDEVVSEILLAEGSVRAYPIEPDLSRAPDFAALEEAAWEANLGLWGACNLPLALSDLDDEEMVGGAETPPVPTATPTATPRPSPTPAPTPTPTATPAPTRERMDRGNGGNGGGY